MRELFFKMIRLTGLPFFFREVIQNNKTTIVLFHDPRPDKAKMIFGILKKKYNVISLEEFISARASKTPLPPKSLMITLDDGHKGNYEILPLIKKHSIPLTVFLCSGNVGTNKPFWFLINSPFVNLEKIKRMKNSDRKKFLVSQGYDMDKEVEKRDALSKKEIKELADLINFQSHTRTHPILPMCCNEEAENEIINSKRELEHNFGLKINTISYPNGDYSERDIELAKKAGYECGITVDFGFNTFETDIFRLKRISINDDLGPNELIVKASGVWGFFKTLNGKKQPYGYFSKTES